MARCEPERGKTIYWTHNAALQAIVEIAFDPERKTRGQTVPRSTYVCPRTTIPHWHLTHLTNASGWKP
jgi:hypothetical protein